LNDQTWTPKPSNCPDPYVKYGTPSTPTLDGKLVAASGGAVVNRTEDGGLNGQFPHYKPVAEPTGCITPP